MTLSPVPISVIIPLYNGARFIAQALDSVFAQTLAPAEVIVVDDGSTDDGCAVVARYAQNPVLVLIQKQNGGQSSARNHGIRHSHGKLIALLDQDDRWYPDHLERLAGPFLEDPHGVLGWSYSNLDEITEGGRLRIRAALSGSPEIHPKTSLEKCLGQDMFVLPSASMISRKAFEAVGGFDEALSGYEDDDLFVRLFAAGYHNFYIDDPLGQWRVFATSSSYTPRMARSRMYYARKLLRSFPDEPSMSRFYARDLIAPRFLRQVVDAAREALRGGDAAVIKECFEDIAYLEGFTMIDQKFFRIREGLLITAVIPLYNGAQFIREALQSIFDQELQADEIIVVDDGSTDGGPEIVTEMARHHSIRLLRKENGGQSSARNIGVHHAHGDLIAFLDQDDVWYPNHLSELVKPFQEARATELGWVYSNLDEINEAAEMVTRGFLDTLSSPHPKRDLEGCLKQDMFVLPSASMISRKAFEAVGGFDEALSGYEDDDLFVRLFAAGYDNVYTEHPLGQWRIYATSSSHTPRMARSRMYYARKLLRSFPDEPSMSRFYARDLIAPRFLRQVMDTARQALRNGEAAVIEECFEDIAYLEGFATLDQKFFRIREDLLITAIIPLYNGAQFIREALLSILDQELPADEIIVVDDGSTDAGPDIVAEMARHHPIRLLRKENGGQSSARNIGVDHAHGDLIAFLDQDDVWYPNHLSELVKPFQEARATELGWVYSNLDEINEAAEMVTRGFLDTLRSPHPKRDLEGCLKQDMFVLPSASMISRKAFRIVGGFDERLSGYEDDDFFLRMFVNGFDNAYITASLSKWRIYQNSSSYSPRMAISRAIYAKKLISQFPNDHDRSRYHVRDIIAPRFFQTMAGEVRKATLKGTKAQQKTALANLEFISRHLPLSDRIPLRFILLPALRVPPLARFIVRHRVALYGLLRRLLFRSPVLPGGSSLRFGSHP